MAAAVGAALPRSAVTRDAALTVTGARPPDQRDDLADGHQQCERPGDLAAAGDEVVPLAEQDRSRWNTAQIAEGRALLDEAVMAGARDSYAVQAAIASLQLEDAIDWPAIVALHDRLREQADAPVIRLNQAVAVAEARGPGPALALVEALDLSDYRYFHSTRAELLRRLGRPDQARAAYDEALARTTTDAERHFLARRRDSLDII